MADPIKPTLTVVQGDWISSAKWLDFPRLVHARSPQDPERLSEFRIARGDVFKAADSRRRQPAYALWSVVLGKAPPVPHGVENADHGLSTLLDAHACFQGIRRAAGEDDDGDQFVVYVLKPSFFFAYEFLSPVVLTTKEAVPPDLVFLVFVRLDHPSEPGTIQGVITHWDFVEVDERNESLPEGYDERFRKLLWQR